MQFCFSYPPMEIQFSILMLGYSFLGLGSCQEEFFIYCVDPTN